MCWCFFFYFLNIRVWVSHSYFMCLWLGGCCAIICVIVEETNFFYGFYVKVFERYFCVLFASVCWWHFINIFCLFTLAYDDVRCEYFKFGTFFLLYFMCVSLEWNLICRKIKMPTNQMAINWRNERINLLQATAHVRSAQFSSVQLNINYFTNGFLLLLSSAHFYCYFRIRRRSTIHCAWTPSKTSEQGV